MMTEESISQEFRLKQETRIYLIDEKNQNELMNRKDKKVCEVLYVLWELY